MPRKDGTARWLRIGLTSAYLLLLAISMPPLSYLALGTLEWHYPPRDDLPEDVRVMVVLSGSIDPPDKIRRRAELGTSTFYRCMYAARLYRRFSFDTLVLSGGKVDPRRKGPTLARAMQDFLVTQGIEREHMLLEDESRSTYENALFTSRLLKERGIRKIVLVTDAAHLYRAERCFRRQGIEVVPAGCRHRATELKFDLRTWTPSTGAASGVGVACHEWLGVVWYWMRGRI